MEDKILNCKDCGNEFVFTAREQQFFADKGFSNQPQRCRDCRQARRAQHGDRIAAARPHARQNFDAVCAECGVEISERRLEAVPFAKLCVECQAREELLEKIEKEEERD